MSKHGQDDYDNGFGASQATNPNGMYSSQEYAPALRIPGIERLVAAFYARCRLGIVFRKVMGVKFDDEKIAASAAGR